MKPNIFDDFYVSVLFLPVHTKSFLLENAYFMRRFRISSTLKCPKTLMETRAYDYFIGTVFKSLRFHHNRKEGFLKRCISKRLFF